MSRRSTLKLGYNPITNEGIYSLEDILTDNELLEKTANKLGKLEDIEEEIGVSLETKDKVERSFDIYVKNDDGTIRKVNIYTYERTGIYVTDFFSELMYYFLKYKNYGKTWALTEEELK